MTYAAVMNHLLQSTAFAAGIAVLCWLLRRGSARVRFRLWLAASVKFLIPVSALVSIGQQVEIPSPAVMQRVAVVERIEGTVFPAEAPAAPPARRMAWGWGLGLIWAAGAAGFALRRMGQVRELERARMAGACVPMAMPVPVYEVDERIEPGIAGIWRPVLLLPRGLMEGLSEDQFAAIVAHEMCHVRERDNLTAAIHMGVETVFWFHPLVWWIGSRMIDERERACDEAVIQAGNGREEYARGVLRVCERFAASPLPCAAGITGSDLKRRVREIMTGAMPARLSGGWKAGLAGLAVAAAMGPVVLGVLQAQTAPEKYEFEVASIRVSTEEGNSSSMNTNATQFTTRNTSLFALITFAYRVQPYQVSGAPSWVRDTRYNIAAKYGEAEDHSLTAADLGKLASRDERIRARVRHMLAERFQLVMREEKKDLPIYKLVVDKDGHKMKAAPNASGSMNINQNNGTGALHGEGVTMARLGGSLSGILGRPVEDETGLAGLFGVELKWSDGSSDQGPTIFTALKEQLGLKLDSGKGPVTTYVMEKVEKPSEN